MTHGAEFLCVEWRIRLSNFDGQSLASKIQQNVCILSCKSAVSKTSLKKPFSAFFQINPAFYT